MLLEFRPRVADGRTAYETMTGHRCKHPILGIGEVVSSRTVVDTGNRHKADADWQGGSFLGVDTESTQFLIGTKTGLLKPSYHELKRQAEETAYHERCMHEVEAIVFDDMLKSATAEDGPVGVSSDAAAGSDGGRGGNGDRGYAPRSVGISEDDGHTYGFRQGCPGCTWFQKRLGLRWGHSVNCRYRLTQLMAEDEDDTDNVARTTARQNEWIAKGVGASEEKAEGEQMHDQEAPMKDKAAPRQEERRTYEEDTVDGDTDMTGYEPQVNDMRRDTTMMTWGDA